MRKIEDMKESANYIVFMLAILWFAWALTGFSS